MKKKKNPATLKIHQNLTLQSMRHVENSLIREYKRENIGYDLINLKQGNKLRDNVDKYKWIADSERKSAAKFMNE